MARSLSLYTEDSKLDFGKYNGKFLVEIVATNQNYICWCVENIDWFCIPDEMFDKLYLHISALMEGEDVPQDELRIKNRKKLETLQKMIQNDKEEDIYDYDTRNYDDDYSYSSSDWLADAAGSSDPEVMNDVYWNLD